METIKDEIQRDQAVDALNLTRYYVTGGINGYPEPIAGKAIVGFDTWEALEAFREEFGGEVKHFHRQNGWNVLESKGTAWNPFQVTSDWYGDDYILLDKAQFDYELSQLPSIFEGYEDDDDYQERLDTAKELFLKAGEGVDWEKQQIVCHEGYNHYDTIPLQPMTWNHDGHFHYIGLQF